MKRLNHAIVALMLKFGPLRDHIWREVSTARAESWTAGLKAGVEGAQLVAERKSARG